MPISGLSHYNLRVCRSELDTIRDYYTDVLGLIVGDRPAFDSFGYWLYADGMPVLHLVARNPGENVATNQSGVVDHVAFQCTDFEGTVARLQAADVKFEARQVPGTTQQQLFLSDPAGVGVELIFEDLSAAAKRT